MIEAMIVIEIMGKPQEYVKEMMEMLLEKMNSEPGTKIKSKEVFEPKPLKENPDLYTAFAEITLELDNVIALMNIAFNYTPSHIEIIKPENIAINNNDINSLFNELIMRLHGYDEIARGLGIGVGILQNQLIKAGIRPDFPPENKASSNKDENKKN